MPKITVQKAPELDSKEIPCFVMIELQGVIEVRDQTAFEGKTETKLGVFELFGGTPILTVGASRLEGSKVKLPNPLILTEKRVVSKVPGKEETTYNAIGVIHEKYLFKKRPKNL